MEQNNIDEILDYINEKFDANIPSFVKMLIEKKSTNYNHLILVLYLIL